nr:helix-turn-helix domain-containing protein [uncultured Rhodopila sp.]
MRPVTFHPQQAKFTIAQAIAYGIPSRSALYRLFAAGTLTPQKIGGTTVVDGDQLRAFMANLPAAPVRVTKAA